MYTYFPLDYTLIFFLITVKMNYLLLNELFKFIITSHLYLMEKWIILCTNFVVDFFLSFSPPPLKQLFYSRRKKRVNELLNDRFWFVLVFKLCIFTLLLTLLIIHLYFEHLTLIPIHFDYYYYFVETVIRILIVFHLSNCATCELLK